MKWLEIIELRSVEKDCELLEKGFEDLMDTMDCEGKPLAVKIYKHGTVETDFSINLYYNSEKADIRGSQLGLCLASALKEFGLVNHSVWVEKCSSSYKEIKL